MISSNLYDRESSQSICRDNKQVKLRSNRQKIQNHLSSSSLYPSSKKFMSFICLRSSNIKCKTSWTFYFFFNSRKKKRLTCSILKIIFAIESNNKRILFLLDLTPKMICHRYLQFEPVTLKKFQSLIVKLYFAFLIGTK